MGDLIDDLKTEVEAQPPPDADPNSAGALVAHIDHVITQGNIIKKLVYGGAAASVIQRDIGALLAQMNRDLETARRANLRLSSGTIHPPSWSRNDQ